MSQCPLCHAQVKDDFGLIECPGCGAQLIVHMDGRLEYQGASEVDQREPEAQKEASEVSKLFPPDRAEPLEIEVGDEAQAGYEPTQMRSADLVPPEKTGEGYRMPEDDMYDAARDYTSEIANHSGDEPPELAEPLEPEKEFLGAESEPEPEPEQEAQPQDLYPDFDGQEVPSQGAVYNSSDSPASPDMSDVARFGNSDISGGREGPLRYNLFIEGVDTVDVREAFREAITDRKLMWDTDQILRSLRNGRVNIQNIAPTKAYILITRLRGLPVQVRWEQYAISQT